MTKKAITVEVKIGDQKFSKDGVVDVFSLDDIMKLLESKPDTVVKVYNAAIEQSERATMRNNIVQENGAPDRALNKTAKQIFEARQTLKNPITMDEAMKLAKAMLGMS